MSEAPVNQPPKAPEGPVKPVQLSHFAGVAAELSEGLEAQPTMPTFDLIARFAGQNLYPIIVQEQSRPKPLGPRTQDNELGQMSPEAQVKIAKMHDLTRTIINPTTAAEWSEVDRSMFELASEMDALYKTGHPDAISGINEQAFIALLFAHDGSARNSVDQALLQRIIDKDPIAKTIYEAFQSQFTDPTDPPRTIKD